MNTKEKIIRISPFATKSGHKSWTVVDEDLLQTKIKDALNNPRKREIHNLHDQDSDNLQRMLNTISKGSYVRPHRHLSPPKSESFVVLKGSIGFVVFEDDGTMKKENCTLVDPKRGVYAVDIRPGVFHTFFALEDATVVFEVKPGPFDPNADKGYAVWAPAEGTPEGEKYFKELVEKFNKF